MYWLREGELQIMLNIRYLIDALKNTVLEQRTGTRDLTDFQGIILLKNQSKLLGNYLYVGMLSDGLRLLKQCRPELPVTMFLSAEDVNHVQLPDGTMHNLVVSALDIFDIYNRINILVQNYHHWSRTLREALCSGAGLPLLLEKASDMLQCQLFVLNPGFKLIAGSGKLYFEEPVGRELSDKGYLSYESSLGLLTGGSAASPENPYRQIVTPLVTYHICEIRHNRYTLATLLLPARRDLEHIDLQHLLLELAGITENLLLGDEETFLQQDALCASFIQDIVEEHLTDATEIENRIQFLPHKVKSFAAFILIRFDTTRLPNPPYSYILRTLGDLFPDAGMAVYKNDIVILHSQEERPLKNLDFDYDKLALVLENYHAYAGISNASRHRIRLRTLYLLANESIRLGRSLYRKGLPERIFSYEDYSLYYIVSLCATQFMDLHHHDDLIYLIHPSIIKICRYDATHKTNLRDVLFYYLLCGCSLNRTAAAMYMHRNTVLNKLNRINEITEIPLEDGYTQQRMIMSCIIMRYYEDYLHLSIRLV